MPGRHLSKFENIGDCENTNSYPVDLSKFRSRIMYIECKTESLDSPGRIGRVYFNKSGKTLYYDGRRFQSLRGAGYKANYVDVDTGDQYWISGPKKNGHDRLYGGSKGVKVDEDCADEYWNEIRD